RNTMAFFFSSRRRHTRFSRDWSSDVCSSDLGPYLAAEQAHPYRGRGSRVLAHPCASSKRIRGGQQHDERCIPGWTNDPGDDTGGGRILVAGRLGRGLSGREATRGGEGGRPAGGGCDVTPRGGGRGYLGPPGSGLDPRRRAGHDARGVGSIGGESVGCMPWRGGRSRLRGNHDPERESYGVTNG